MSFVPFMSFQFRLLESKSSNRVESDIPPTPMCRLDMNLSERPSPAAQSMRTSVRSVVGRFQ